jgi:hypothetical protein
MQLLVTSNVPSTECSVLTHLQDISPKTHRMETMYEAFHHCAKTINVAALILNYKKLMSFFNDRFIGIRFILVQYFNIQPLSSKLKENKWFNFSF